MACSSTGRRGFSGCSQRHQPVLHPRAALDGHGDREQMLFSCKFVCCLAFIYNGTKHLAGRRNGLLALATRCKHYDPVRRGRSGKQTPIGCTPLLHHTLPHAITHTFVRVLPQHTSHSHTAFSRRSMLPAHARPRSIHIPSPSTAKPKLPHGNPSERCSPSQPHAQPTTANGPQTLPVPPLVHDHLHDHDGD